MKKLTLGLIVFIGLGAVSLLSYKSAEALKADCCKDGSKCCTESCCENHK